MSFLNETLHPKAHALNNHILAAAYLDDMMDSQFYTPLQCWQTAQSMTDEKTADLYARMEDAFDSGQFLSLTQAAQVTALSRCLWANDKAVAA